METLRKALGTVLLGTLMIMPGSLFAADTNAAMVYARGTALVNGAPVPRSLAIFPGDRVETKSDSEANITAVGSSVTVLPDSTVKFESSAMELEQGSVAVATSHLLAIAVADIVVTPVSGDWTEFQVSEERCRISIAARKGDLSIRDPKVTTTLSAGQETSRGKSKKGCGAVDQGAHPTATVGILDSKQAIIGGAAAVTGLTIWVLLQGDEPVSPAKP